MKSRLKKYVFFALVAVTGQGCFTQKMYPGSSRSMNEVAVIVLLSSTVPNYDPTAAFTRITKVDGKMAFGLKVLVLPGHHNLIYGWADHRIQNTGVASDDRFDLAFVAEAGKTYYVFTKMNWNVDPPVWEHKVKEIPTSDVKLNFQ